VTRHRRFASYGGLQSAEVEGVGAEAKCGTGVPRCRWRPSGLRSL